MKITLISARFIVVWIIFALGGLAMLTGCGRYLDISRIEAQIKSDITEKGKLTVKSVTCPQKVEMEVKKEFECVGLLEPDGGFFVNVTQKDDQGDVTSEVLNSWKMLNLSTLEDEFQQVLKSAKIDCAGVYRVVKQGDSFNCKSLDSNQTIIVKIENAGRITWQEVKEAEPLAMNTSPSVSSPSPTASATDRSVSSPNPVVSATNHPSPSPAVSATSSATATTATTSPAAKSSPSKNESDWKELGD